METARLKLRPWQEQDANALYNYAKDARVGPRAGWMPHTSVENSLEILRTVLMAEETYAIILKETDEPIGSIGLMFGKRSELVRAADECEIGYWIAVPYWGQGMVPEAMHALLRHAFEDLKVSRVWCGYFDGNRQSLRVQEKCGFRYHHTEPEREFPLIQSVKVEHVTSLSRAQWCRE